MARKTLEEKFHATRDTSFNEKYWNQFVSEVSAELRSIKESIRSIQENQNNKGEGTN